MWPRSVLFIEVSYIERCVLKEGVGLVMCNLSISMGWKMIFFQFRFELFIFHECIHQSRNLCIPPPGITSYIYTVSKNSNTSKNSNMYL